MRMLSGSKALVSSDVPVLYIDEEVLVINKPSGLICDYDTKEKEPSTITRMCKVQELYGLPRRPIASHRLDKATTGAMIWSLTSRAYQQYNRDFEVRAVKKTYLAVVRAAADRIPKRSGSINGLIQRLKGPGWALTTTKPCSDATLIRKKAHARSDWKLLATSPTAPLSLIEVQPHTGFTHQIRAHMAEILDAPILGDRKYTPPDHYTESELASRHLVPTPDDTMCLHAAGLTFFRSSPSGRVHSLTVCAPLPEVFVRLCGDVSIPLPDRYINGALYIDDDPVKDSHPVLNELGGRWMPKPGATQDRVDMVHLPTW
ncbi:hypothetical protein FOMPIDRAFT_1151358 [Fomitopsis schrenkii]|uniref:Pseudouridine synthase RsuA/RluA-like domain-containing protein n=1 Tax=Fomitopsis schrenkii TaxID=2126942 RepID=S8DY52_FOMSC|nr:hypothetical protein FOMPIDRAFT_1151358 [Fomitopsis schrenkii]